MAKPMRLGMLVVLRSAHALRSLLYPVGTLRHCNTGICHAVIGRGGDTRDVINYIEAVAASPSVQFGHQFGRCL